MCQWFEELGLEEYHESIHTHEITGKELLDLHRSDLMVSECLSLASFPPPVFDHLQYAVCMPYQHMTENLKTQIFSSMGVQ